MQKSITNERYKILCSLLIEFRKNKNLTQAELAERIKKPQSFVSKYESCERRLDVIEFIEVCKAMGADPNELIIKVSNIRGERAEKA